MSKPYCPPRLERRHFLSMAAATAVAGCLPASPAADVSAAVSGAPGPYPWIPDAELLAELPGLMRLASVPGLSIAVVDRGAVVWARSFGVLNASTERPVLAETRFEAASMSKPVFAYGVLQLAEQQRLDLDRPLAAYYRPAYLPGDERIGRVTARHVLSHTSGLPNWGNDAEPETLRPAFEPGARFRYSGEGFFWLQLVVERITGLGLDAFMRAILFEPAGMRHSAFAWDEALLPDVSFGHRDGAPVAGHGTRPVMDLIVPRAQRWRKPVRDWLHEDWLRVAAELDPANPARRVRFVNAAGSLLTTASDYARFLSQVVAHAPRASWEISEQMRVAMLSPLVAVRPEVPFWWGLGWTVENSATGWRVGHEGNNENVFTSYAGADPARGRALVILTNAGGGFGLYQRIARRVTGHDQLSFIAAV
jgi:CubicO group peptidase (beta-lactamase class C family)